MKELQKVFGNIQTEESFNKIRISIASPDQIRSWSYGEVKKPETINYRTFKPEKEGLFCAKIFGPVKDYECLCGKYKRIKYRGVICEKCGVEVTLSKVRRDRMGHIELACPVGHIWFFKSLPSKIGTLIDLPMKKMEQVIYFDSYIVIEPGLTPLKQYDMISEEQYESYIDEYGEDAFRVGIGAEALREILASMDLEEERKMLRLEMKETKSEAKKKKIVKRLKLIEAFIDSKSRPEWMVMDVLPVIPPELRPLVPLDGGRFATSDLNDLYRRVINRNNRLKRLMDLKAPEIIVRNEKRMLQESVDALFDNSMRARPVMTNNKRPYKSLADTLKGKQGRFRQNLLGKRVDYSGRSAIVAGPELKLHQCGLPKRMALELFKPFIYSKLEKYGHANTIKTAKKMVERELPEVWDILEEVIKEHPVLLNRAPTLHKLSIQAFEPQLIEGKAIQLHPLVCSAFNADFDGDQMAVHVPLSLEAQLEARVLMLASNNIIHPASGKPIITPSQDMILGIYYITSERDGLAGEGMAFSSLDEVRFALENGKVHYNSKIKARFTTVDKEGNSVSQTYETTPGRIVLGEILPRHPGISFDMINQPMGKKQLEKLIFTIFERCGEKETVIFCDKLKNLGFEQATLSGVSFGKDDLKVPVEKKAILEEASAQVREFEQQYQEGLITRNEKYNKVTDTWGACADKVTDAMLEGLSKPDENGFNSIYMMANSGARGSKGQMKQLAAMRGLMAKPDGTIIETPIISNFKEGMTVSEYFTSTHGGRKGLADTALKTASAGYLTRKLVDVAQDAIVTIDDCGTENGITLTAVIDGSTVIQTLGARILGRTAAEDILHPDTEITIVKKGDMIDEEAVSHIENAGIEKVFVRSTLTCESLNGVCQKCYGRDLVRKHFANIGEAVGVLAAQSIGEPGTQLTMRTFHVGGTAQTTGEQSSCESSVSGTVAYEAIRAIENAAGESISISRNGSLILTDERKGVTRFKVPYGSKILVKDGEAVKAGVKLAEWDPYTWPIITEKAGKIQYADLIENVSYQDVVDESTGISSKLVSDWRIGAKGRDLKPHILLTDAKGEIVKLSSGSDANYLLSVGAVLAVENGQDVQAGDILARLPRESAKTKDITGGLPRVSELFDARRPKDHAILVEQDGRVEFGPDYRTKHCIRVVPEDGGEPIEYYIPKGKHFSVQTGDFVHKGDYLVEGDPAPADILRVLGVEALADYLIQEIQGVYRLQGVDINDKHFEVIIRQMLKKKEIIDAGDTTFLVGEQVDVFELAQENEKVIKMNGKPAEVEPILLGITKASLQTRSFISAASFQQTTQVLTEAAVAGKEDELCGLKENVIVGRLIPAGTGAYIKRLQNIAKARDDAALEQEAMEEETPILPGI